MHTDEREICSYLKGWPGQFVALAEICLRAGGKRRFREDPNWAVPVLKRLVEQGKVESDSTGHYRLRKPAEKKKPRRWVAPHIRKALEASGKNFEGVFDVEQEPPEEGVEASP